MIHHFLRIVTLALVVLAATGMQAVPNLDRVIATQLEEVAARPNDPAVHNDLGNLLVLAERLDEAERAYRRAKDLSPADSSARFNLGLLLQQQERFEEAYEELGALIDMEPEHAWAHYQLGMIEHDLGNRGEALDYYAKAFALDPTLTFERNNPHIIDNDLATEALLRSSQFRQSAATSVPRSYGEGARLRELMLQIEEEQMIEEAKQELAAEAAEHEAAAEHEKPVEKKKKGSATGSPPSLDSRGAPEDEMPLPRRRPRSYGEEKEDTEETTRGRELGGVTVVQPVGEPVRSTGSEPTSRDSSGRVGRPSGVDEQSRRDAIRERLRGRRPAPQTPQEETRDLEGGRVVGQPERDSGAGALPRYNPSRRSTANLRLEILDDEQSRGAA